MRVEIGTGLYANKVAKEASSRIRESEANKRERARRKAAHVYKVLCHALWGFRDAYLPAAGISIREKIRRRHK